MAKQLAVRGGWRFSEAHMQPDLGLAEAQGNSQRGIPLGANRRQPGDTETLYPAD
jgi:hypothetical protein